MKIGIYENAPNDSGLILVGFAERTEAELQDLPFYVPSGGDPINFVGNDGSKRDGVISSIAREYDCNDRLVKCEITLR